MTQIWHALLLTDCYTCLESLGASARRWALLCGHVPGIEITSKNPNGGHDNLLHYVAIEATFTLPHYRDWQLVYRLQHRSGVIGLMSSGNAGNTAVQLGVRHYFE